MNKALWKVAQESDRANARPARFSKKMSDHIAYALLVYTGINILLTVGVIKSAIHGSILSYCSLAVLVAMIIPACRSLEHRWEQLDASTVDDADLKQLFNRDRVLVWAAALILPLVLTGAFKLIAPLI